MTLRASNPDSPGETAGQDNQNRQPAFI